MTDGVIVGGWSYVVAAYSITAAGLLAYAWSLVHRRRKTELEQEDFHHE